MPSFRVKALAVVEFEVEFPPGVTASQARTRLVDDSKTWASRRSVGIVDDLIRVESVEPASGPGGVMPTVKRKGS